MSAIHAVVMRQTAHCRASAPRMRSPGAGLVGGRIARGKRSRLLRIDLVLFRGAFGVADISLFGNQPADGTSSGLWPSDHAGVAATLLLPSRHADNQ